MAFHNKNIQSVNVDATTTAINTFRIFWNQLSILGSTMGDMDEFRTVIALHKDGMKPVIDSVHDAQHSSEAFARLESGEQFGKVVLKWTQSLWQVKRAINELNLSKKQLPSSPMRAVAAEYICSVLKTGYLPFTNSILGSGRQGCEVILRVQTSFMLYDG